MGAPLIIAKACDKLQGQITSAPSSIAQRATLCAVNCDPKQTPQIIDMVVAFKERRDLLLDLLKDIPGLKTNTPDGAFYVFPDVTYYFGKSDGTITVNNADDLSTYIIDKVYVALVSGGAFGSPDCIRISYATSKERLIEAVKRIKAALADLK